MTLRYPLGLLGLIGIPILILIYIIKNRYTEQTIPSTYIWNLSEKFLKRRVPISRIAGILSLILQILTVIMISFAMTQPIITIANSAYSYCFVLDSSASMQFVQNGHTRFDIAKSRITSIIDRSANGSEFTFIISGKTAKLVQDSRDGESVPFTDKETAKLRLSEQTCNYSTNDDMDALAEAQKQFDLNPSTIVYLFTDKDYIMSDNVNIVDVSEMTENYALSDVEYGLSGGRLKISGTVTSYASDEILCVELYFDDEEEPSYYDDFIIAGPDGEKFEFTCTDRTSFRSLKVRIANEDALPLDNEVVIYDVTYENVSDVLLVSDKPFFIQAALTSAGVGNVDVFSSKEYEEHDILFSYGLYIFDTYTPKEMPDDGAVWFFNPRASVPGANFSYQGNANEKKDTNREFTASFSDSTEKLVGTLLNGVTGKSFKTVDYVKCGVIAKFTTLITCDGFPLLFVGTNTYGNREAVFAFDVHDSAQFTLMNDFSTIVSNLISYSFPTVIDRTMYVSGEKMLVNVIAGCTDIRIEAPSGKLSYPPNVNLDYVEYELAEVGTYNIYIFMKDGSERVINVYATVPEEERSTFSFGDDFLILGTAEYERRPGFYEILLYLFIALGVFAIADYGVYCYEQYQLR